MCQIQGSIGPPGLALHSKIWRAFLLCISCMAWNLMSTRKNLLYWTFTNHNKWTLTDFLNPLPQHWISNWPMKPMLHRSTYHMVPGRMVLGSEVLRISYSDMHRKSGAAWVVCERANRRGNPRNEFNGESEDCRRLSCRSIYPRKPIFRKHYAQD